jgi:3-dehydroquinate dehydratase-1
MLAIGAVTLEPARPRIVAAGGDSELGALATVSDADVVEVRVDLFADPRPETLPVALDRLRAAGRPIILTVRSQAEGGGALPDERRRELYVAGLAHADAIDLEIASALAAELVPRARAAGKTVILSAHDLERTPPADALTTLVDRAMALGAHVTKLATYAHDLEDLRTLLGVTLAARARGIVTLALGPVGPLSRITLPAAGSLLTYGHVGRPTAPSGQLAVTEVAALVRRLYPPS